MVPERNSLISVILCLEVLVSFKKFSCGAAEADPPTCPSDIYCYGKMLDTIQMTKIYPDSKTFVDMKIKHSPEEAKKNFDLFMKNFGNRKPTKKEVQQFVKTNFEPAGQEFEDWVPGDWRQKPSFINKIKDKHYADYASKLNSIWKILGRKIKSKVYDKPELYSLIWVPNPVIVPGGRFREFYYWDTYWIIQGLLLSEMQDTVRGMLENFLFIVEKNGHVPNGGRVYYLARSQPPLLIPMIKSFYEYTQNKSFIMKNIATMDKEFDFWITKRTKAVNFKGASYKLAYYGDKSSGPRPESYWEDVNNGAIFKGNEKEVFYSHLKAAAESGWDFSSRWFITNATNKGNLTNIQTRSIIPVDLNAIIYWNAVLLREFHTLLANTEKANYYQQIGQDWIKSVTAVLWHEKIGAWLDFDTQNNIKRDYFYPSNISPLWTGCYDVKNKETIATNVVNYLKNKKILFPGGVPTSVESTGEQWDYPNAWPPLQHIMIVGLNNTGNKLAVGVAAKLADEWVQSNYMAFKKTGAMFEKYDANIPGYRGGGGEYDVQLGFGWSNGVIIELLYRYRDTLIAPSSVKGTRTPFPRISLITATLIAFIIM